jgi:hypothetical protein
VDSVVSPENRAASRHVGRNIATRNFRTLTDTGHAPGHESRHPRDPVTGNT